MNLKERFEQIYPTVFFLEKNIKTVEQYLHQQNWLEDNEALLSLEKPGEGNMNFVLRATTNKRSFILKQARPWVEKFPQIDAPVERVSVEAQFFQSLQNVKELANLIPSCLGFDADNFMLATEDLGVGADYSFLYQKGNQLSISEAEEVINYLSVLHRLPPPKSFPENKAMRVLNHEHIFNFPYLEENGFNLDEVQIGLQAIAMTYKTDESLKAIIKSCGTVYLASGKQLLHGDFYPGSWLKVPSGLKVIDPEFGFVGRAEFDLGVLIAHLVMGEQGNDLIRMVVEKYKRPIGFDDKLLAQLAGIEILRRLIGIAQLPLNLDLSEKELLLKRAAGWIRSGQIS